MRECAIDLLEPLVKPTRLKTISAACMQIAFELDRDQTVPSQDGLIVDGSADTAR